MRITRPAVCFALAASLLGAGVAHAAVKRPVVKPVCNLVKDDAGDASIQPPIPSDDSVDVLGGDLASDAKKVTAVIRVKNLAATSPAMVTGRNYYFQFTPPKATYPVYFSYETDPTTPLLGGVFNWGDLEPGTGGVPTYTTKGSATGVIDSAKNEIRITVPVSDVGSVGSMKVGGKVSTLSVNTTDNFGVVVATVDDAAGSKPYIAGSPSCVKP